MTDKEAKRKFISGLAVELSVPLQVVRLYGTGESVAVVRSVRESEETVRRWLKRYLAEEVNELKDMPYPGATPKMTPAYEQAVGALDRLQANGSSAGIPPNAGL